MSERMGPRAIMAMAASCLCLTAMPAQAATRCTATLPRGGPFATLDVTTVGAVGDGTTDDTDCFNAAIGLVSAGGTLIVPAGTYVITRTLTLPGNLTLSGQGFHDGSRRWWGQGPLSAAAAFGGSVLWLKADNSAGVSPSIQIGAVDLADVMIIQGPASPPSSAPTRSQLEALCANAAIRAGPAANGARISQMHWSNVRIVGAACGVALTGVTNSRFDTLQIAGVEVGLALFSGSDGNTFFNTQIAEIAPSGGIAIEVSSSSQNRFYGGAVLPAAAPSSFSAGTLLSSPSQVPPTQKGALNVGVWFRSGVLNNLQNFLFADAAVWAAIVIDGSASSYIGRSILGAPEQCIYTVNHAALTKFIDLEGQGRFAQNPSTLSPPPTDCFLATGDASQRTSRTCRNLPTD